MNRKKFLLIVVLTVISLVSIVVVQLNWIFQINELNDERFDKDIRDVLFTINQKLEEREIINLTRDNLQANLKIRTTNEEGGVELIESFFTKKTINQNDIELKKNSLQFKMESNDLSNTNDDENINASIVIEDFNDILMDSSMQSQIDKVLDRSEMIQIILNKLLTGNRNIKTELSPRSIEELISTSLKKKNISINFNYLLLDKKENLVLLSNTQDKEILKSKFSISLFQNDLIDSNLLLFLSFPFKDRYLNESNIYSLIFSLLFITLIAMSFYYVILKAFHMKKLSDIKNDFIDNMTHELKTPISTISIACEAMQANEKNKNDYVKIINEENKRLGNQVERVLNIARTEKENYKIEKSSIDVHDIIEESIDIFKFKIKKKEGKIIKKLNANNYHIQGNKIHMLNVFNNLIENALKYSKNKPFIVIKTKNNLGILDVSVKDKGIGIRKNNLDKIFDKFYRESQGNIHDVKGFGLGLSYVKNIIDKLGAKILVKSKHGSGSTFTLKFNYEK